MAGRTNDVIALIAKRSTGKTTFILGDESKGLKGIAEIYLKRGMKVLIVDSIDHPAYRKVPVLPLDKMASWKQGMYRVYGSNFAEIFSEINKNCYNTLIVFEDAYKYLKKKMPDDVIAFLIDSKQKNLDILFMYHAWGWTPPDLFRMVDSIEIFKCKDSPKIRKDDLGNYNEVQAVFDKVSKHPSPYYHQTVDTGA